MPRQKKKHNQNMLNWWQYKFVFCFLFFSIIFETKHKKTLTNNKIKMNVSSKKTTKVNGVCGGYCRWVCVLASWFGLFLYCIYMFLLCGIVWILLCFCFLGVKTYIKWLIFIEWFLIQTISLCVYQKKLLCGFVNWIGE